MTTFCIVCLYVFVCVLTAGQESNVTDDSFVCKCSYVVTCQWGMCVYVAILMGPLCKDGTGWDLTPTAVGGHWWDLTPTAVGVHWWDLTPTAVGVHWWDLTPTAVGGHWWDLTPTAVGGHWYVAWTGCVALHTSVLKFRGIVQISNVHFCLLPCMYMA